MSQRKILWFWLPLAASWALMTLEGPIIQAAIARMPDVKTMLAAAGIVISLQVTIESPVIMLLATSTALSTSPHAYRVLRRFVLHLTILLTLLAAAIAFIDPVYQWLILGVMGIPGHIAEAAQPAMKIMTCWSAAIGWRRFYQGILIRYGLTGRIGYGTTIRLVSATIAAFALASYSDLSGIMVGAYTWMIGVMSELIYAYWAVRSTISTYLSADDEIDQPIVTYWDVVKYHTPLGATSLLALLVQPLIGAGLARMAFVEENLAAWPVIFSLFLFFRSFGLSLPEVIIALLKKPEDVPRLRRFALLIGTASTGVMALIVLTPLINLYLLHITGVTSDLVQFIIPGTVMGLFIPALQAIQSWLRGVLMVTKVTSDIYWGMGISLIVTILIIFLGVLLQTPGASTAAVSLTFGMLAETIYLWWRVRPAQARFWFIPRPSPP